MEIMENTENLKDKLFNKKENGWEKISAEEKENIFSFCKGYMDFLNKSKIEREFIANAKIVADQNGFKDINTVENLKAGDKVYFINREKSMYLAVIGNEKMEKGINIIGSHVDSPRLDLKPNPIYEDNGLAYFKTFLLK